MVLVNVVAGAMYPLRAAKFLLVHARLWKYLLIPFVINVALYSLTFYGGAKLFAARMAHWIPSGDAWYWAVLSCVAWVVAVLLAMVLVFFTFALVGNLIAAPFNDLLSERAEQMLSGEALPDAPFSLKNFLGSSWRMMMVEVKKMLLFVAVMAALLLVALVPVAGPPLFSVLGFLNTALFLAVEYVSLITVRKNYTFRQLCGFVRTNWGLMLGLGSVLTLLLAIPFLNCLCIPLGVVAAVLLWCDPDVAAKRLPE